MAVDQEALRAILKEALLVDERGEMTEEVWRDLERRALEAVGGDPERLCALYSLADPEWAGFTFESDLDREA